jgi:hypothetical protein
MNSIRSLLAALSFAVGSTLCAQPWSVRVSIPGAAQPQLAVAADGRIWLAYGRLGDAKPAAGESQHAGHAPAARVGEIFVASSSDGGATFGAAVRIARIDNLMLGMRRGPRIVANGDRVTVTAIGAELIAITSTDGGKTWSAPATINDVPTSAREGLHDLAAAPDGQLFVTWLDLRNGKTELWGAASKDGGQTWAKNEQVYRSPDKSICECCHPTALFDADGHLAVMWRNAIEGSRDMWMTTRSRGASSFASAKKLGDGTWQLNACPMDGGKIVALGNGNFASVWQRNGEIFFAPPTGPEVRVGPGKQPVAIARDRETLVVWQRGNDLVSARTSSFASPRKHAENARFPVLVALPKGGGALLAYEQGPAKGPTAVVVEGL